MWDRAATKGRQARALKRRSVTSRQFHQNSTHFWKLWAFAFGDWWFKEQEAVLLKMKSEAEEESHSKRVPNR